MKTCDVEVWVMIDADGDYAVGGGADEAADAYGDDFQHDPTRPTRMVKVLLQIPLPCVPTLTGVVPAEGDATLAVG